jgi:hypothetical protein
MLKVLCKNDGNQPQYVNAYINMAALKLEAENAVIAQMNKLGIQTKI